MMSAGAAEPLAQQLERYLSKAWGGEVRVRDLARIPGGASRETYRFDADVRVQTVSARQLRSWWQHLQDCDCGLAPLVRKEIWAVISTLKEMGIAVLLVDKSVEELRYIADRFLVLEKGRIAYEADRTQVLLQPDRLDKYLHI